MKYLHSSGKSSGAAKLLLTFTALLFLGCVLGLQKKPRTKPKAPPQTHTVTITGFKFVPETLTVNVGDTVEWKNEDITSHTATGKSFDSKNLDPKASWKYVAGKQGTYAYICNFHPTMKAVLIVK